MPLILQKELPGNIRLGLWQLAGDQELTAGLAALTAEEKVYLAGRKSLQKQQQFVAARVLLAALLGSPSPVQYRESGRPYLPLLPGLDLSISHSGPYVAVAVAAGENVGVDVEVMPRPSLGMAPAYFLNARELAGLKDIPDLTTLHLYWSAKEALFKYAADPGLNLKDDFYVYPGFPADAGEGYMEGEVNRGSGIEKVFLSFRTHIGYVLAATCGPPPDSK